MRARLVCAAAAALLVTLLGGPAAHATMTYAPCSPAGFACAELAVPLDHDGATPGTVLLHAKRRAAGPSPSRSAVVALAGGPGQAALPIAGDFAELLAPALATRDLLVFDQRGTGSSSRLSCHAFERPSGSIVSIVARCASQLGPARAFFRSADSVEDIEALRAQSGYDQLVLFGVSYGTKVALDYAAKYPSRVEALVLDSVVPPEGSDVLNRSTFAAINRVLIELCSRGACRGVTTAVRRDLAALATKVRRRALRGAINDSRGKRMPLRLTAEGLFLILLAGDLNPTLRAELPGSMRSALRGNLRPILRLQARAEGLSGIPGERLADVAGGGDEGPFDSADSEALFATTRCEESRFPWDRAVAISERERQTLAAARAQSSKFKPFGFRVAIESEAIPLCLGWPEASPTPAAPLPLPPVRTLIIGGGGDLRTPLEDDLAVAALISGAHVLRVPHVGHSVLSSDLSGCAQAALSSFFAGQPLGSCDAIEQIFSPTAVAPTSLDRLPGRSEALRTIAAVRATVTDIRRQFIGDAIAAGRATPIGARAAGLRSGTALWTGAGIRLRRVEYVPGVLVSGLLPHDDDATATYVVGGPAAARGNLKVAADGSASGRLGGRRVGAAAPRAAARALDDADELPEHAPRYARLSR